eukprot:GILI01016219.1.p1 GENE.GILI01016219.1~~GILI01016219.1.p1  ORF type:complete len:141 (+),score=29.48 GILI01016219.1:83-505(+)
MTVQNSSVATSGNNSRSAGFMSLMAEAQKMANSLMQEKEWQCPCGHKFRAHGEWIATVPAMCEVPTCPNPKFYLSGAGRALLEASPQGVRLEQVDPSQTIAAGSGSGTIAAGTGTPSSPQPPSNGGSSSQPMGGRFGPRK